jgi:hypothetical protein
MFRHLRQRRLIELIHGIFVSGRKPLAVREEIVLLGSVERIPEVAPPVEDLEL